MWIGLIPCFSLYTRLLQFLIEDIDNLMVDILFVKNLGQFRIITVTYF